MTLANAFSLHNARFGPSAYALNSNLQRSTVSVAAVRSRLPCDTSHPKVFSRRVRYLASRAAVVCIAQAEETAQNVETLPETNGAEAAAYRPLESTASAEQEAPSPSGGHSEDAVSLEPAQADKSNRRGRGRDNRMPRRGGRTQGDRKEIALSAQDPRRAPCTEHNLKRGDVVAGRVIRSTYKGCNIELLEDTRIVGFAPTVEGPFFMRDRVTSQQGGIQMPVGLVREFRIKAIPEDMEYYGKGPLLSAKDLDLDVLWDRANQIKAVCDEDMECVTVKVTDANSGGMLATIESLPAFIPYSLMAKPQDGAWLNHDDMQEHFIGKDVEVTIKDVSPESRKVVLNMQQASVNKVLKNMQVGSLVWGTVRRVEPYGVFVGIDGTRFSGLLHISCISKAHVEAVEDIFSVGDRVRAMLVGMEQNFSRISLSTAELESTPGDMLYPNSRPVVYENAEEMAAEAVRKMQQREEDDRFYGDNNNSGRDQGFDFDNRG